MIAQLGTLLAEDVPYPPGTGIVISIAGAILGLAAVAFKYLPGREKDSGDATEKLVKNLEQQVEDLRDRLDDIERDLRREQEDNRRLRDELDRLRRGDRP